MYVADVEFFKSTDGGRNFNKIKVPHGDNHGLWIDPKNTRRMIASNDGGVTVSLDGGNSWTREDNQPTAQFYHVITDTRTPYYVYGAQQDNSTVAIASRSDDGAIGRDNWYRVGGGEAGYIAPNPTDPNIVYAGDYQGNITRFDRRTNQVKNIAVSPELSDARGAAPLEHRFQWTAPIVTSPHDPNTIYYGGERIFKTTDGGTHWEAISGDLTRNDKSKQQPSGGPITVDDTGTEYYDTVFSIAPSPLVKGLIWAGTDDGLIQLTRDEGKTWTNVTPQDLAEWSRISLIEASPHDAGTAYVAIDRHQNDDLAPYIYKTNRLRRDLDPDHGWHSGRCVCARRPRRPEEERSALCGHRARRLCFVRRRSALALAANQSSDRSGSRSGRQERRPGSGDARTIVLDSRRRFTAASVRRFSGCRRHASLSSQRPPIACIWEKRPAKSAFAGKNPPTGAVIYYYLKPAPKPKKDDRKRMK